MADKKQPSGVPPIVLFILGVALMVGGFYLSNLGILKVTEPVPLDFGKTVATIGVFLILFKVIEGFYISPLREAISERDTDLERTFTEAESLRTEMEAIRSEYELRLVETEAAAREQIQSQIREAQNLRQSLIAEAGSKADALVREAQEQIASERDRIINELRIQVVDLTLAATERLIGENMDNVKNRRLIEEFIEKAEVKV